MPRVVSKSNTGALRGKVMSTDIALAIIRIAKGEKKKKFLVEWGMQLVLLYKRLSLHSDASSRFWRKIVMRGRKC